MTQKFDFSNSNAFSSIVVVIPSFNSEKQILRVLTGIPSFVSFIIVVDDCSPDCSADLVQKFADQRIIQIKHEQNMGVGAAMKTGYKKAIEIGADIIIKMDSDGQMDPKYLPQLISPLTNKNADYAKGNRFLFPAELNRMPPIRRIGNTLLSFLTKFASGYWNIFDPTNGYTAITRKALNIINLNNLSDRFFFESSMLLELCLHRIVVKDVNIPAIYNNEKSTLSETKTLFEFPPKLFKGFLRRIKYMYFLMDFSAVSLLLFFGIISCLFGSIWGLVFWIRSATLNVAASTGTVMIAVMPIILGMQFLLQALVLDTQNIPKNVIEE